MNNTIAPITDNTGRTIDFIVLPLQHNQNQNKKQKQKTNMTTLQHNAKHTASVYLSKFKWTKLQMFILATIAEQGSITDNLEDIYRVFSPKSFTLDAYNFKDTDTNINQNQRIGIHRPSRLPSTWRKKDIRFFIY